MYVSRASRSRKSRLELEIEKHRAEGNFNKALELVCAFKGERSGLNVCLYNLVFCESRLILSEKECTYAIDFKAVEAAVEAALRNADDQYRYEATILKAKIAFIQDHYAKVVELLTTGGIDLKKVRIDSYASRFACLLSEGFAMLGISKERLLSTRPNLESDEGVSDEIYELYELAGSVCIRYLQEVEPTLPESLQPIGLPKSVDTAIKRQVVGSLQQNDMTEAVQKFRSLLRYVETPSTKSLRQSLARQLAELLLRVVCTGKYYKYIASSERDLNGKPRCYPADAYVPDDQLQEAILMLLISEYIASQDVILNRSSDLAEERIKTVNETIVIYDLLAIALVRKGYFSFLSKTLERALKFSYQEFQIWYQFALSLVASQKYYRAYLVLRECQRIDPSNPSICLLASSLCLGRLHLIEEGIFFAKNGVEIASKAEDTYLCARSHLMLGWGYSISARECQMLPRKVELQQQAIEEYTAATKSDPEDYLAWYHLAVELAIKRKIVQALKACQRSILLAPTQPETIRLLALLHTASASLSSSTNSTSTTVSLGGGRHAHLYQAVRALHSGLADRPHDFSLLFTLAKVEAEFHGPEAGLKVYMHLIDTWCDCFPQFQGQRLETGSTGLECLRDAPLVPSENSALDLCASETECNMTSDGTMNCEHIALLPSNRLETILTELASGGSGSGAAQNGSPVQPQTTSFFGAVGADFSPQALLAKILGCMAELYLESGRIEDAQDCVAEAVSLSQINHELLYLRGRIFEATGRLEEARTMYESAIAINPSHIKSLYSLANTLKQSGQYILAEQALRDALAVDSTNSRVWRLLGEVLSGGETSNDPASKTIATTAFLSAIELEQTEPLEPFYTLRLGVHCS
uniref:Tetratricopeptide repeat protein 7B n=1 Tax=Echinococcus granulosus TaxID=6210 RepID=A0A068W745_ECHGR|nr:tetratricopeptide repeat protein 7B [Echinococcus granulosus]